MNKILVYGCLISFLGLVGCGIHVPISERIVFGSGLNQDVVVRYYGNTNISRLVLSTDFINRARADHGDSLKNDLLQRYLTNIAPLGLGVQVGDRFAVGFTPGLFIAGMGADFTIGITSGLFFTGAANFDQSAIAILQHRVFTGESAGIGLGVFAERTNLAFDDNSKPLAGGSRSFITNVIGGRLLLSAYTNNANLNGHLKIGLDTSYKTPVVSFGFSISFRSSRKTSYGRPQSSPWPGQ